MSVFSNLTTTGLEETQDRLGGFAALPSDAYVGKIKTAYAGIASASKAQSLTLIVEFPGTGEYRETFWITNRNGENFFINKGGDANKKSPLPGFSHVNDICLICAGKELSQMLTEDKVMNIWDANEKKELPKSVPMLTELLDQSIGLGILRQIVFKQEKNTNGDYVDTAETRTENVTDKVFHPEANLTINEAKANITEPDFMPKWIKKNKGVDRDKTKGKGGPAPQSGRPGGASTPAPTSSLFAKK